MSKKVLTIWFDQNGNLSEHSIVPHLAAQYGYKSEDAKDFVDTMKVLKIQEYRRRSARVQLQSTITGRKYSMYIDGFNKVLENNRLQNLHIEGTFRFLKRSSGQAIELLEDKP